MIYRKIAGYGTAAALLTAPGLVQADVKMPAIFGDHMVLQQETVLPVWGTADPGEKVTVTVGKETARAEADANGKWLVKLPALPSGTPPVTLTVTGKNTLTFNDALVGEVWVCSGQSNMEFPLFQALNGRAEVPKATDSQLRFFLVKHKTALQPESDVEGSWQVCSPETAKDFTAVGYFFGRELRSSLGRPVGLIEACWGGSPAQSWTSLEGLQKEPTLQNYVARYNANAAQYPKLAPEYPAQMAAYEADMAKWKAEEDPKYQAALKVWLEASKNAKLAGQPEPPIPAAAPKPVLPKDPTGGPGGPSNLFNGMIAPLVPYAIKGAIWYQGEANAENGPGYRTLFSRMITDWREHWAQGDFPFLFVQLASLDIGQDWPSVRESQLKTLSLPNTAMASAVDLGDYHSLKNFHPIDKLDVGLRLALAAKKVAYGQDLVYSGPIYAASKVEGNTLRVSFTHTGSGLVISRPPWIDPTAQPWPTDKIVGFEIAGADGNYVPADAKIDGNDVVISSQQISEPSFVRFAWSSLVWANLYNKEGLPAAPFRTDNQPPQNPLQRPH